MTDSFRGEFILPFLSTIFLKIAPLFAKRKILAMIETARKHKKTNVSQAGGFLRLKVLAPAEFSRPVVSTAHLPLREIELAG